MRLCALIIPCVYSSLVPATDWALGGIVGAGNPVAVVGLEAQMQIQKQQNDGMTFGELRISYRRD